MGSNFNTQSRDKNQIRANFGYKRIGENSNPYPTLKLNNAHATTAWILSRVYSQPLDWSSRRETRTLLWLATTEVRRNGTPHTFIQGTESVIYSDLSSVLVIESRHGTDWKRTQAHSLVVFDLSWRLDKRWWIWHCAANKRTNGFACENRE
jgi:hypothetical protein